MALSILEYLRKHLDGSLQPDDSLRMRYPPPIAATLGMRLVSIDLADAVVEMQTDPTRHANPMGTIHGGVLCDLADLAIGTAHATTLNVDESFTTVDLKTNFFRPVWQARLRAHAKAVNIGKTTSYYECRVTRDDGKLVAIAASTVMTLRGDRSAGR